MDKAEFKERWDKAFTFEAFKKLVYTNPHPSGMSRDEVLKKQQIKSKQKNKIYNKTYYEKNRERKIKKSKIYYQTHKKERLEYQARYKKERLEYQARYKKERLLLENDEPTRAEEELKRFTQEERRAFEEWERQNKKRTVC